VRRACRACDVRSFSRAEPSLLALGSGFKAKVAGMMPGPANATPHSTERDSVAPVAPPKRFDFFRTVA
jgi:hypothetical protein